MSDAWGGAFGESWGESWGSDSRQVGGKSRKQREQKKRRFQLPDGTHVFGTEEEVAQLLQVDNAPEPVFVKKLGRKPVIAEGRPVVLEVDRFLEPSVPDPIAAFSQTADLEAIAVQAYMDRLRRRRKALLLL